MSEEGNNEHNEDNESYKRLEGSEGWRFYRAR
jgi:hypothetical protein